MNRHAREGNCRARTGPGFPDLSEAKGKNSFGTATCRMIPEVKKPLSALEIGVDRLGHLVDRQRPGKRRPVDEKGGGRLHLELVDGALAHAFDAIKHLLIREAGVE